MKIREYPLVVTPITLLKNQNARLTFTFEFGSAVSVLSVCCQCPQGFSKASSGGLTIASVIHGDVRKGV